MWFVKLFLPFFLFAGVVTAQQKNLDHTWLKADKYMPLPDSLKKHDAVYISYQRIVIHDNDNGFLYQVRTKYRARIFTKKGIENFAIIHMAKSEYNSLEKMDARTIKPDGRVVDLQSADIKRLDYKGPRNEEDINEYRFSVPAVEVGDDIEVVVQTSTHGMPQGQDLFLFDHIPILSGELSLKYHNSLIIDVVTHNHMPELQKEEVGNYITYTWHLKNIKSVYKQNYARPGLEMPYVSYMIRFIKHADGEIQHVSTNFYDAIYDVYTSFVGDEVLASEKEMQNIIETYIKPAATLTPFARFTRVCNYMRDSFEVNAYKPVEGKTGFEKYFKKRAIDARGQFHLIRALIRYYKLEYYIGAARNRYEGEVDGKFVPPYIMTDFFFGIKDDSGTLHVLFPRFNKLMELDEVPFYLKDTEVLLLKNNGYLGTTEGSSFELGTNVIEHNIRQRNVRIQVDHIGDTTVMKVKEVLSGDLATYEKHEYKQAARGQKMFLLMDMKKEENDFLQYDTVMIDEEGHQFPFALKVSLVQKNAPITSRVDEKTIQVTLKDLLTHTIFDLQQPERTLTFVPPFVYKENFRYLISLPVAVSIGNAAALQQSFSNEYGAYKLGVSQMGDNRILVESEYEVHKQFVTPEHVADVTALNKSVTDACNTKLYLLVK